MAKKPAPKKQAGKNRTTTAKERQPGKAAAPAKMRQRKKAAAPARPPMFAGVLRAGSDRGEAPPPAEDADALAEVNSERVFNCRRSVERPGDLLLDPRTLSGDIPPEVDYRAGWWRIGDQKKTGSCVGWAVGDGLVRWYLTEKGLLLQQDSLSVRYFWMAAKEMDEFTTFPTTFLEDAGTSIRSALEIARQYGCVLEDVLPFGGGLYQESSDRFYALANQLKLGGSLQSVNKDVDQLRRWLARQGPIAARLLVDRTFLQATANQPNLDDYDPVANTHRMGHAVVLVGYRPDGRLIVRNSWKTTWGERGFAYAHPNYLLKAFTEFFGIYR